ncbi:hypothetical protein RND81_05G125400 [Saponaria officinalis]|uniref:Uncharacterized protein n=1 Tax=Saponaria officinalis TaxID=3572 RepID=A0AAW1KVV1_SAPOF
MGTSPSKRVQETLQNSTEFNSACSTTFTESLSLTQHTSQGIFPYQLLSASTHLHQSLSSTCHLVHKWVPSPPSHHLVDAAYHSLRRRRNYPLETLDSGQFRDFAVELFANAVVLNARKAVLSRVPVGVVGIAGVAAVGKVGKEFVSAAVGAYALGVVTSVYISLG